MPKSCKTIKTSAFSNCTALETVKCANVTAVYNDAFADCTALTTVEFSETLDSVLEYAFKNCTALETVKLPEGCGITIFSNAFTNSGIMNNTENWNGDYLYIGKHLIATTENETKEYTLKKGTLTVAEQALPYAEKLVSCGELSYMYSWKNNIKEVVYPEGTTYIFTLFLASKVEKVTIPASVKKIKYNTICEKNKHKFEGKITVKPTCVKTGEKSYQCKNCVYHYEEVLAKDTKAHKTTVINKKADTCTAKGYTGDTKCTLCNKVVSKGKTIAAKGHKTTNKVTKATTTANGKIVATCSTCKRAVKTTTVYKISSVSLSTTKYYYTGKQKTPTVTVKDSKGKKLKNGTDYTVSMPSGRKKIGKYTVKVTFKGNYSGTKSLSFTIVPKSTSITEITAGKKTLNVEWKKQSTQTTGYQIQYSTSKKFSKAKTVTVSKIKTTSKTISKLKSNKTYYVRVRTYKTVGKTKYYSNWSSAVSKKTKK